MSANKVANLGQTLLPATSYSQVAIAGLGVTYPVGSSLQIGPDGAANVEVTLQQAAQPGDENIYTNDFTPPSEMVSGLGIFDPTVSTGAGTTGSRPSGQAVGAQFYDTTLGKPVWFNGNAWTDATGAAV